MRLAAIPYTFGRTVCVQSVRVRLYTVTLSFSHIRLVYIRLVTPYTFSCSAVLYRFCRIYSYIPYGREKGVTLVQIPWFKYTRLIQKDVVVLIGLRQGLPSQQRLPYTTISQRWRYAAVRTSLRLLQQSISTI